jgi:NAD(P)H-quinone oxidoreductase subunit 5
MLAFLATAFRLAGIDVADKPGGMLLGGILAVALTQWLGQVIRVGSRRLLSQSLVVAGLLCVAYVASFVAVDKVVASSLPVAAAISDLHWVVVAVVVVGFAGLFALHRGLSSTKASRSMQALYVHASNGFYVENVLRRVFGPLSST